MRIIAAIPLLLAAGCSVQNDTGNDQMTIEYNQQRLEDAAASAAGTAKEVGSGLGNVAASAGQAIKQEVGDVDVDLDVTRNRPDPAAGNRTQPQ
jgi:hypothetical protein